MEYTVMIAQFILSLSILIILHELGHFIPAKLFKTRVEKFYLFFDPWFSIFKKKINGTEYGIGWLPLGGYVKISGMIDESMDKEQMKLPPQPWEFRSKPAWQRLVIMLGGVTVNFILGFLLFGMILFKWGEEFIPAKNLTYGISVSPLGVELGLQNGDKIISVGNTPFEKFNPAIITKEIVLNNARTIKVQREGQIVDIPVNPRFTQELSSSKNKSVILFAPRLPFKAFEIVKKSPAMEAGVLKDDQLIGMNGEPMTYFDQFEGKLKNLKKKPVQLTLLRNNTDTVQLTMTTTDEGKLGIYPYAANHYFKIERKDYSFAEAIPAGVSKGWNFLGDQIKAFKEMFRGNIEAKDSLGGFASITSLFPTTWDWEQFWHITAILSLILGFMNLLPIPALDGGHVMFLLFEVVTGRKLSDKFMEIATTVGFVLIISLVLYANGLDVFRFLNK